MHIPNQQVWQEIIASPQFIRFTNAIDNGKKKPNLIIKADSLLLKYLVSGVAMEMHFFETFDYRLGYSLFIHDDDEKYAIIWSLVKNEDEFEALQNLTKYLEITIHLYNESCTNCAWTTVNIEISPIILNHLNGPITSLEKIHNYIDEVHEIVEKIQNRSGTSLASAKVNILRKWNGISNITILNGNEKAQKSTMNLLSDEEGTYQEQVAHSILGNLGNAISYINPKLLEKSGEKEFTDILIASKLGSFIIESKTLSIFKREALPIRTKLSCDINKKMKTGIKQLKIASRKLHAFTNIYDTNGGEIDTERNIPLHAVILIPDLSLIEDNDLWLNNIEDFKIKNGDMLHVLDIAQLFRMSQAASMISESKPNLSPIEALYSYLTKRYELVKENKNIQIDMILRIH